MRLGGGPSIATVSVDESQVRGEAGPLLPQLVLPLQIAMDPQPDGQMLAVTQLQARLYTDQQAFATSLACRPADISMTAGFLAWSMTTGKPGNNPVELRF